MKTFQTMMFVVLLIACNNCTPAPSHFLRFPVESIMLSPGASTKLTMSITKTYPDAGAAQIKLFNADPELTVTPTDAVVVGDNLEVSVAVSSTAKIGEHGIVYSPIPGGYGSQASLRVNVTAPK